MNNYQLPLTVQSCHGILQALNPVVTFEKSIDINIKGIVSLRSLLTNTQQILSGLDEQVISRNYSKEFTNPFSKFPVEDIASHAELAAKTKQTSLRAKVLKLRIDLDAASKKLLTDVHQGFYRFYTFEDAHLTIETVDRAFRLQVPLQGEVNRHHPSFDQLIQQHAQQKIVALMTKFQDKRDKDQEAKELKRAKAMLIQAALATPVTLTKGELQQLKKSNAKTPKKSASQSKPSSSKSSKKKNGNSENKTSNSKKSKSKSTKKQDFQKGGKGHKGRGQKNV